jgi:hypothetical protein
MSPRPRAVSPLSRLILWVGLSAASSGCPTGAPGVLSGAVNDARFVSERATLVYAAKDGLRRISLDGTSSQLIFAGAAAVLDVTPDFQTFVLTDSDTNLLIGHASTGRLTAVRPLAGRLSSAALSPDGKRIAASRHADFSLPQAQWVDDDGIFLVDIETGLVTTIAPSGHDWPTKVAWAADGQALWLSMAFEKPSQWLTLADRSRDAGLTRPPAPLREDPRAPAKCAQTFDGPTRDPVLRIIDQPGAAPRTIARLVGRKRGFHDYSPDFDDVRLSPQCRYALFHFHDRRTWIVDVRGGPIGPVADGCPLFFQR